MNNIQRISDAYLCSNCGACVAVCPKDSIEFQKTSMGRYYTEINDSCIECGLCTKVCPSIDSLHLREHFPDKYYGNIINTYIGKSASITIFENAQSGGGVTAILKYLFDKQKIDAALLCRITIGTPSIPEAVIIRNADELGRCQKSCYTPIPLLCALKSTRGLKSVAIVGLPCHLEGLSLIQAQIQKYKNIEYKLGLVCDRTLTETIQKVAFSYSDGEPRIIHWRDKYSGEYGVNYKDAQITLENGDHQKLTLPRYYRTRLKDFFTAPRCRVCSDKINIQADIVFGDPWGIEGVDWINGESLFITRTEKGEKLLSEAADAGELILKETPMRPVLRGQHIYEKRYSVAAASKALKRTVNCDESPLLDDEENIVINQKEIDKMQKLITDFISRENQTDDAIVEEARSLLSRETPQIRQSFISRVKKKLFPKHSHQAYNVLLSGVETDNKGAELMLYAILQELERVHPEATVFLNRSSVKQGLKYIKSPVNIKFVSPSGISRLLSKVHIKGLLYRLCINTRWLDDTYSIGKVDLFLDGSGLLFSDQMHHSKQSNASLSSHLKNLRRMGAKIVYLPQAFGPVQLKNTQDAIKVLDRYADLVFAREQVSYRYLEPYVTNKKKFRVSTDFTSLVNGIMPKGYEHLKDAVCVIPNERMISKGIISRDSYISFLTQTVNYCVSYGKKVYLLNHEGKKDEELAFLCKKNISDEIEVVSGLTALEVKGLISSAYLVISSRFHGVASSLNSCVPCLSTSWNHKYEELYKDFNIESCVLPMGSLEESLKMVKQLLDVDVNLEVRNRLKESGPIIKEKVREMWKQIWAL